MSSLATEMGRSTTSPAAIFAASCSDRSLIVTGLMFSYSGPQDNPLSRGLQAAGVALTQGLEETRGEVLALKLASVEVPFLANSTATRNTRSISMSSVSLE